METIHPHVSVKREQIERFCDAWKIERFEFFGSVLRDDFDDQSDIDVLVTFAPDAEWRFSDLLDMEDALHEMFGRNVDLVERRVVEQSPNWIRRRAILGSATPVYASA